MGSSYRGKPRQLVPLVSAKTICETPACARCALSLVALIPLSRKQAHLPYSLNEYLRVCVCVCVRVVGAPALFQESTPLLTIHAPHTGRSSVCPLCSLFLGHFVYLKNLYAGPFRELVRTPSLMARRPSLLMHGSFLVVTSLVIPTPSPLLNKEGPLGKHVHHRLQA